MTIVVDQALLMKVVPIAFAVLFGMYGLGWVRGFSKAADQLEAFRVQYLAPKESDPPGPPR